MEHLSCRAVLGEEKKLQITALEVVTITCLMPNANLRTEGSKGNMNKFCSQGISLEPTLGGTL